MVETCFDRPGLCVVRFAEAVDPLSVGVAMSTTRESPVASSDENRRRENFLAHLGGLIDNVEAWARDADWSTRRIDKTMREASGTYPATGLLMQKEFCRILLDPIGSSSFGDEGVVDLYRMPEYDDVARLYFSDGQWRLHFVFAGGPATAEINDETSPPISADLFNRVLETMSRNAA